MGRWVTPAGVEVEMGDDAARAVGYAPVKVAKSDPQSKPEPKRTARKGSAKAEK